MIGGKKEAYVLVYVCSLMDSWTNTGSIVWVRPGYVLTDQDMADISVAYERELGWSFPSQFCADAHEQSCPQGSRRL